MLQNGILRVQKPAISLEIDEIQREDQAKMHLEGFYAANLYCLRLGRLGNAWIFKAGGVLCSKSLLFSAWKGWDVN